MVFNSAPSNSMSTERTQSKSKNTKNKNILNKYINHDLNLKKLKYVIKFRTYNFKINVIYINNYKYITLSHTIKRFILHEILSYISVSKLK